jgi:anti-anti-sigma factor
MMEVASLNGPSQVGIVSRRLKRGIVLVMSGEIDLLSAPAVEHALLRAEEVHDLVAIDLRRVSFLDSTGLHLITEANARLRERGGRLLIVEGPPQVSRVFELTGLSGHLDVVADEPELERVAADGAPLRTA